MTRLLGPDHRDTLLTQMELARARCAAGDFGRAISLLEQTVTDMVRVLGAHDEDTLSTRNELGAAYVAAGDLAAAAGVYDQALSDCVRAFGAEHPLSELMRQNLDSVRLDS